ncbi:EF-hand calcium-binding domain-containing protein 1-like isoform X1 [Colias croceus]|uniref:EF-hand calcium-binding domain-containing protein 1-like isoform X1 n=1 Tax=Colias crocea TaxID=72248 RepID=UPI001E27F0F9|nr:EF-hand calcium-binding domain-containing protein 1-like isoform X1 [Colias croceus]
MTDKKQKQISMAASAIALKGVRMFLKAGRAAVDRSASPIKRKTKPVVPVNKIPKASLDVLLRTTRFNRNELEAVFTMYRRLVTAAQAAAPPSIIGQPVAKIDGIDQSTFRDVMHNTFDLVTEEIVLDRIWSSWDRGVNGGEGALKFEAWAKGLSVLLRGNTEEKKVYCFNVYDLNADGYITRDEMFVLLKNSLLKQPGDEDPDEGVRDLVELVLRKLDIDKDGKVSLDDYRQAVQQEPLLLEAFGQCVPSRRHAATFLKTLSTKQ